MSPSPQSRRARALLSLAPALVLMVACSESAETLADVVADEPAVTRVSVTKVEGDDGLPFATIPKTVKVEMGGDATADEVMAVFGAYNDAIDDGDVTSIEVALAGPKGATLASGEDVHVLRPAVDDLVAAQADADVLAYRRQVYPVLPSIDLEVAPTGFEAAVSAADRYRGADDLQLVTVRSGAFLLIRDAVNADQRVTVARERLVRQVAARFALNGATVSGRGPLKLNIAAADAQAVLRFADRHAEAGVVGRVVVVPENARD